MEMEDEGFGGRRRCHFVKAAAAACGEKTGARGEKTGAGGEGNTGFYFTYGINIVKCLKVNKRKEKINSGK